MKQLVLLVVSISIALATLATGVALQGRPDWQFTLLDAVVDVAGGIVFGLLALTLPTRWATGSPTAQAAIAVVLTLAGILTVLTVEGGAPRELIFGL